MESQELIKQVKLRPAIWNPAHQNRSKMAFAWRQVCKIAWPDFDSKPLDEKRAKCLEMQKKWKILKQLFTSDYIRQKQGTEQGTRKSQYYGQLQFLIPAIDIKGLSSDPENNSGGRRDSRTTSLDNISSSTAATSSANRERDTEEDKQFLLSLLSFIQDVPRASKLPMRAEILQAIAKYSSNASLCPAPEHLQGY